MKSGDSEGLMTLGATYELGPIAVILLISESGGRLVDGRPEKKVERLNKPKLVRNIGPVSMGSIANRSSCVDYQMDHGQYRSISQLAQITHTSR